MSEEIDNFQNEPNLVRWKIHFASSPEKVYQALTEDKHRNCYWAEKTEEKDGKIRYVFFEGLENTGEILESIPNEKFVVTYFDFKVTFLIESDDTSGSDMEVVCESVPEDVKTELIAGWVSWLMAMKGYVDFGIDLRNHDPKRTWFTGYADN